MPDASNSDGVADFLQSFNFKKHFTRKDSKSSPCNNIRVEIRYYFTLKALHHFLSPHENTISLQSCCVFWFH